MGLPAAKEGDRVEAIDTHIVIVDVAPVPLPHPFNGTLLEGLSANVRIMGRSAATVESIARNIPPHIPEGESFVKPPTNMGRVLTGSLTVRINGKAAARSADTVLTCNDPVDLPVGKIIALGTVLIG